MSLVCVWHSLSTNDIFPVLIMTCLLVKTVQVVLADICTVSETLDKLVSSHVDFKCNIHTAIILLHLTAQCYLSLNISPLSGLKFIKVCVWMFSWTCDFLLFQNLLDLNGQGSQKYTGMTCFLHTSSCNRLVLSSGGVIGLHTANMWF